MSIKKRVAVFEYTTRIMSGCQVVYDYEPTHDVVRISEWMIVEFPERDKSEVLQEMTSNTEKRIKIIKEKAADEINKEMAKLAISHE